MNQRDEAVREGQRRVQAQKTSKRVVVFLILILVAYGGYKLFANKAPESNKPTPGTFYEAQSRDHIAPGAAHPEYNSNPPTGGWHYATPAQTGIYDKELPDEQLVHNLEHSHVWISYKPDLDKDGIEKLADLAKKYGPKMIMTPRTKNDSLVTLVTWQYLIKFDKVDDSTLEQMDDFIQAHRGRSGPENPLDFGFSDFRGKEAPSPTPMSQ